MRPHLLILALFLASLLALTRLTGAQEESLGETAVSPDTFIAPPDTDSLEITVWEQPETTLLSELILSPLADAAADFCSLATPLTLTPLGVPAASQTNVANFTNAPDDPPLSCAWGSNPPARAGYRTAWHRFTPAYNGMVTISTITSQYDTILGVFTGSCGAASLQPVACNDDAAGFTSEATFPVRRGVTYYVLVGDWQPGALSSPLQLNLQASYDTPLVSEWTMVSPINEPRTRHATAVVGTDIYVLGGLTSGGALSNSFFRYNTTNNTWGTLNPIPGGIMNTTAVYLPAAQRIHVPGGTIGANDTANSSTHWTYSLNNGAWSQVAPVPGSPFAYATAVSHTDGFYLLGGVEGPGWPVTAVITDSVRSDVLFYQTSSNSWSARTPLNSARYGHTAAAVGDRICVAGGLSQSEAGVIGFANPIAECANRANPSVWTPTGSMNVPRYFAHSAVGPDGRWYVYGGLDGTGNAVPEVEFYDPASNTWQLLPFMYDLNGRQPGDPALIWPRGGFVGNQLWSVGGNFLIGNVQQLNPNVKRMNSPKQGSLYLPMLIAGSPENFTFATARPIFIDQVVSQGIESVQNRYRFFELNMAVGSNLQIELIVPDTDDLDLYLFNDNKVIWGQSDNPFPGDDERICLNSLLPGRYFVVVERPLNPLPPTPDRSFLLLARTVATCP